MSKVKEYILDDPYLAGISGKYNLLIMSVAPKYPVYEYELADLEGRKYKAVAPLMYAVNQLLRCQVYFNITSEGLVVSDTLICGKQNLALPVDKTIKSKTPSVIAQKTCVKTLSTQLGAPIGKGVSGICVFLVKEVEQNGTIYNYCLEDSKGRYYKTKSKKFFKVGLLIPCFFHMEYKNGIKSYSISVGIKKRYNIHNGYIHYAHRYSMSPSPCKGDHFHLIYTPMGNKR